MLLCANDPPDGVASERLRTIASVARSYPSCVDDVHVEVYLTLPFLAPLLHPSLGSRLRSTQGGPHLRRVTDYQNGTVSYSSTDDEASSEMKKEVRRSLWFGSLAVSSMAGMMQWTAAIGAKQGTSKVSSASRPGPPFCPLFRYTDAPTLARWRR